MTQSLPSLEIVLALQQTERTHMMSHLDSLDTKAGVTLGFSGVLVALAPGTASAPAVISTVAAMLAALLAVFAFWPRSQPTLLPEQLQEYVQAEPDVTRARASDTLRVILQDGRTALIRKGHILQAAMIALTIAALMFAIEQIGG